MKKKRLMIALIAVVSVFVILFGGVFGAFLAMKHAGRLEMEKRRREEATKNNFEDYEFDPNVVRYNGSVYKYNSELSNILFLGIDKDDSLEKESVGVGGAGQCDVILLVSLDESAKKASILSIDRNTMTDLESYDEEGAFIGTLRSQIALSYTYGDGKESSCELSCAAVSDLLFEVPIHTYYSMSVSAVSEITDMVGGVKVKIPVDMTATHESFIEGEEVTLDGETVLHFLRARMELEDASNAARLARQKQYISALIPTVCSAMLRDASLPSKLYKKVIDRSCTDISLNEAVYLASLLPSLDISFYGIEGETVRGESFDEFTPDETALYELVLDIFYTKVD